MQASLELLEEIGAANIAGRIAASVKRLAEGLTPLGFEAAGPTEGPTASGLLTMSHPRVDADRLFAHLKQHGVTASYRRDRAGRTYLRFSPHFYNTDTELDRTIAILREAV